MKFRLYEIGTSYTIYLNAHFGEVDVLKAQPQLKRDDDFIACSDTISGQ
jgi:hypothetical protein